MSNFDKEYSDNAIGQLKPMMEEVYKNNMRYLKDAHQDIYLKIVEFENLVQNNKFINNYKIVFTKNYFNLLIKKTNKLLFEMDAKEYASSRAEIVNYDKTACFEILHKGVCSKEVLNKINSMTYEEKSLTPYEDIIKFTKYIDVEEDISLENIYKFIFVGSLLGTHILEIDKKIDAKMYLILEPNIEMFYHSLFLTDYNTIAQNKPLFISIGDDNEIDTIRTFLDKESDKNYIIKYHLVSTEYNSSIENIILCLSEIDPLVYSYEAIITQMLEQTTYNVRKNYKYLIKDTKKTKEFFEDKPVIIVSPGSSLQQNIKWLKKNQDKFIIISFIASLSKLYKNGIKANIVTNIDAKSIMKDFLEDIDDDYLKDVVFITTKNTHRDVLDKFSYKNIYLIEMIGNRKTHTFRDIDGWSVGEVTYRLVLGMKIKNIYLLGTDMAFSEDGHTHDDEHSPLSHHDILDNNKNSLLRKGIIDHKEHILQVKGNFREEVSTNIYFNRNLVQYNKFSKKYKKKFQNVYNLSDGAYIDSTVPLKIEGIDTTIMNDLDKNIQKELFVFMDLVSEIGYTKSERKTASKQLKTIKQINKDFSYLQDFEPKTYQEYKNEFYKYYLNFKDFDILIMQLFKEYFLVIHNLLEYKFNNKNISQQKKKKLLKKFFKIELVQINRFVKKYIQYLRAIKESK